MYTLLGRTPDSSQQQYINKHIQTESDSTKHHEINMSLAREARIQQ